MSQSGVADRYAKAIFELGVEAAQTPELTAQLANFASVYTGSPELRSVLENPLVNEQQRDTILKDIAGRVGLSPLATTSVRYLASRRRLACLPDIARRLAVMADQKAGVVRASVTSAAALPESFYERLKSELEAITGRKIVLERKQDPSLIAGVITRIGDNTIDGSVRGSLEHLERQLQGSA